MMSYIARRQVTITGGGSGSAETNPVFTYTSGNLTSVVYASGNSKVLTYSSGLLSQVDYIRTGLTTIRKTFAYANAVLSSITQTEF